LDSMGENEIQQKLKVAASKSDEWNAALKFAEQKKLRAEDPAAFIYMSLPPPLASAMTNADGKCSMVIPTAGSIILVAHSSREIGSDVEQYYWFCRVSPDSAQPKSVILSNQNLLTNESALKVLLGIIPST